ncbi:hypothetical protein ACFWSF_17885 [Streptomyces sp. NPDC058611]|uniref:D-alanyl-D-alanine carboxypeptidase n=1 Tax=unclassified Streptomyces TaxID=2593676 RepID=UPI003653AB97
MAAIEEELVAGESPDKSVDAGAPGAAESSAERDPRLSVFRPREPEDASGGAGDTPERDPLREAVAAWVATADAPAGSDEPPAGAEPAAGDPAAAGSAAASSAVTGSAAAGSKPGVDGAAAEADSRADAAEAEVEAEAVSQPGAVSGSEAEREVVSGSEAEPEVVSGSEPEAEPEPVSGSEAEAEPASDLDAESPAGSESRSASCGGSAAGAAGSRGAEVPKPSSEPAEPAEASDADSGSAAGPGSRSGSTSTSTPTSAPGEAAADSERTAVFRAVKPPAAVGSGSAGERGAEGSRVDFFRRPQPVSGRDGAEEGAGAPKSSPAESGGDSERTAVFRAVTPPAPAAPAATPPAKDSASVERPAADAADSGSVPGEAPADSERTAVFRAVKPPAAAGSGSAGERGAEGSRVDFFRRPQPVSGRDGAEEGAGAPKSSPAESGGDSERTAVFRAVTPPAPAATPPAKDSASTGRPGAAGSGAGSAAADSERTAVFRAVKPPVAPAGDAGATGRAAPPKASTFVPLRTDGAPAPAVTPKPAPKPAPTPAYESPERTTQQPLPPKPPLDMLADLTNNPPPPPSPLRTAVRRFKIYAPVVVLLAIVLSAAQLVRPLPEPTLVMTAKSSYTFEGAKPQLPWPSEGQAYMAAAGLGPLGQSGEQKPVPIASVTKSMTAYIILRDHPIKKGEKGAVIDVDKTAESEGRKNNSTDNESTLDTVKEGDKLTEYDAIAALMIPSANNIARLLARWDSGSQEAFVKKMNDTAKDLGMKNTTYTDPSGLDATTVSTAEDQVKLGLKLVEIETLLEITKRPSWQDPSGKVWRNWNGLVPFNESLGIKTGTTTKAGGNLLFAAYKDVGKTRQLVVGAVLGQHKPPIIDSVLAASKQLMTATQKSLNGAPVVQKGDVVGYVDDGLGGRTPVVATADVQAVGWGALTVGIELAQGDGSKIPQTAKAGTEIGVLTVGEGASQVKVPVALKSDLASPGIGSKLTRVG